MCAVEILCLQACQVKDSLERPECEEVCNCCHGWNSTTSDTTIYNTSENAASRSPLTYTVVTKLWQEIFDNLSFWGLRKKNWS